VLKIPTLRENLSENGERSIRGSAQLRIHILESGEECERMTKKHTQTGVTFFVFVFLFRWWLGCLWNSVPVKIRNVKLAAEGAREQPQAVKAGELGLLTSARSST